MPCPLSEGKTNNYSIEPGTQQQHVRTWYLSLSLPLDINYWRCRGAPLFQRGSSLLRSSCTHTSQTKLTPRKTNRKRTHNLTDNPRTYYGYPKTQTIDVHAMFGYSSSAVVPRLTGLVSQPKLVWPKSARHPYYSSTPMFPLCPQIEEPFIQFISR